MSSHYRELNQYFADANGRPDFDTAVAIDASLPIKQLFQTRSLLCVSGGGGGGGEAGAPSSTSPSTVKPVHETTALLRTCNAVLKWAWSRGGGAAESPRVIDALQSADEARMAWKFLATFADEPDAVACMEAALTAAAVDFHYATARPRQFDMFVHLSATEKFFIDGDSLLMAALSSPHVDWDLVQPLHVLYNAQALLRGLQSRGAQFHVIFFRDTAWFWERAPQKLFLREALRATLSAVAATTPERHLTVDTFDNFYCPAFADYISRYEPEFLLMSDGEQLGRETPLQHLFHNHTEEELLRFEMEDSAAAGQDGGSAAAATATPLSEEEKVELHQRVLEEQTMERKGPYRSLVEDEAHGDSVAFYYRCLLTWATARRIKVAYSSRIVIRENAVVVFAVTVESGNFARSLVLEPSATKLAAALEHDVPLPTLTDASLALTKDGQLSRREQVVSAAVHAYLHATGDDGAPTPRTEQQRQLCQVMVITAYCTALLSAELRAQRSATSPAITAFLDDLAPYLLRAFQHCDCATGRGAEFDIFDGHLVAAMAHLLRTTPAAQLLDEDGVADVNLSWQDVSGDESATATAAALAALPDVAVAEPKKALKYPHLSHDLVDQLARAFQLEGHVSNRPYPATLGNANELGGWIVSQPFDELNDVVDVQVERESQRNLTERERRKLLAMEAAFVTDAAQQAESMGIRGFTAGTLAVVCSDNDDDEAGTGADGAGGGSGGGGAGKAVKKVKQQHTGQRNKKVRSREEVIREEANMRDANKTVQDWAQQVSELCKKTDQTSRLTDVADSVGVLTAAISRMMGTAFGRNFDPGEVLTDGGAVPLPLAMWRLLVETSGMREAELAFTIVDDDVDAAAAAEKKKKRTAKDKRTTTLHAFGLIADLVEENITQAKAGEHGDGWGKLERLRKVKKDFTVYDATSYLHWVYLVYVQLHFQCKLMARVVRLQLEQWKVERERARQAGEAPNMNIGVPLFLYCHHKVLSCIRDNGVAISTDDLDTVRSALAHFDFPASYYEKVDGTIARWQSSAVSVLPPSHRPRQKVCSGTPEMLQLMSMGHLLERPVIPTKDYRVVFNPDKWQRDLLDIVDSRGSAVVCAPTSAGKTFISYYCMYSALKTSNTKVVVYVAPNRALINQAVADVCARYGSKKYSFPGRNVYGVHGGADYHRYVDSCQVLVTLPEVLETLLLSPKYKDWATRLDYVILDEIHSMESSGNGDVWERVLALLPCPFVALSATLGETQQLCGWLNRVQKRLEAQQPEAATAAAAAGKRDFTVHDIPSSGSIQRWNDIKKYMYLPPPGYHPQLKKLTAKYPHRYIHDLHPLSILTLEQLQGGFPPDITLVPSEVVQLHQQMCAFFSQRVQARWSKVAVVQAMKAQLSTLLPEAYFQHENYITQQRARQYEADVKNAFAYWAYLNHSRDADGLAALSEEEAAAFNTDMRLLCEAILQTFSQRLREDEAQLERYATDAALQQEGGQLVDAPPPPQEGEAAALSTDDAATTATTTTTTAAAALSAAAGGLGRKAHFPESKEFIADNIISVLRELNSRDMAPTIVFTFEGEDCDDLTKAIVERLEDAEAAYRQTEEFAQYRASMERKAAAAEAARKQRESTLKQKKLTTDDGGEVERADRDVDGTMNDDEDYVVPDVLPEFTFIGQYCTVDPTVVKETVEECVKRGDTLSVRAIRRGVGIHHAGVKGKLRRLMEILFRGRHCGVICATETLALGVHSPCRSVVLAGDHVLLNTTQFRQMMGRAGRRGLDHLGHLIFLSVSMKKVTRLMTSSMTVIKGNVQVDPLTQLRLLQLYDYARHRDLKNAEEWSRRALGMAERLFINPLFFAGRAAVEGGNMEYQTIELAQMLLGYLHREGLHFKDRPSSLGSLLVDAMYVFRNAQVGAEGFAFLSMITRKVFAKARLARAFTYLAPSDDAAVQEAKAELLAYTFSVNKMCGVPLEIHRSVLSDPAVVELWVGRRVAKQHRVVLAPLDVCSPAVRPFSYVSVFRMISAFYTYLASTLKEPADTRLPYMCPKTKKKNCIFGGKSDMPLMAKLRETAEPFAARDPFVAVSGCGDHFVNTEDLVSTLRRGLFCDRRMLPILDLTDGCRHDGAQVLINACITDFVRCKAQIDSVRSNFRFTLLEELNGLSQSESYAVLNQTERLLSNVAGLTRSDKYTPLQVLSALYPDRTRGENLAEEDAKFYAGTLGVMAFAAQLHELRPHIDKELATVQWLARIAEMQRAKK
ncbi:DEAD/DEAH box helicase [Novymonas esmeraldas]|uniref:DEAD/DEAH box helicase n=1 Tax=Novymonas esmeraldas TaxID=1808958 RepID=A0AAW0EVP4_9TRYP